MVKLTAIQLCSTPNVEVNLAAIELQLRLLIAAEHHLVVLPECCLFFGGKDQQQFELAIDTQKSNYLRLSLASLAKKYQVTLVAGSIPLLTSAADKFTNSCCVYSPQGEELTVYDKIHLFDVTVEDNEKNYQESRYTQAGMQVRVINTAFANVGLSICYDLRFPELFRQLKKQGADIITVPSAFTRVTGKAHWQTLLQARAIENQVYIIAAGQEGTHANGRETWGHSMIISPWGEVLTSLAEGIGAISTEFLPQELLRIRAAMPVEQHNKFTTELT